MILSKLSTYIVCGVFEEPQQQQQKNVELITCLQISKFINVHTCVLYIQQSVKSMARARIYPKRIHFKPFNDSALLRGFQFVGITLKHFDTFDVSNCYN